MDGHLAKHDWFVGDGPTVADLALYPFTSVAGEGDLDMAPYSHVAGWLRRVEALPGFSAMPPYPQPGPYAGR
jgi:glutathione S-transferase